MLLLAGIGGAQDSGGSGPERSSGTIWVDDTAHTVASLGSPKHFRICALRHTAKVNERPGLVVEADGRSITIEQHRRTDVEGPVITVTTSIPGTEAEGRYHLVD